jgi:hypothetical protein
MMGSGVRIPLAAPINPLIKLIYLSCLNFDRISNFDRGRAGDAKCLGAQLNRDLRPTPHIRAASFVMPTLITAIADAMTKVAPTECGNYLANSGYRHQS